MSKEHLKVIILVGVPASGKSTWAKAFVKENPNYIRVNRDDFRFMMKDQDICTSKVETIISELINSTILSSLNKNLNVIIDNTNLKQAYITEFIELVKYKADVEFKIFDVSLNDALVRDLNREKKVGEEVIKRMYKDYLNLTNTFKFPLITKVRNLYVEPAYDSSLEDIIVFDLDGTLFHHNDTRSPFSWMEVDKDVVDEVVAQQARFHKQLGHKVIIVSGRDDCCKALTESCLQNNNIPYDAIFMRKHNDMRKDTIIKTEIYQNEFKGKFNVKIWYDDRQCVVDTIRALGIKVFQVNEGNF